MKRFILYQAIIASILICSCSHDEPQYPTPLQITEIVTVYSNENDRMLLSTDHGRVLSCISLDKRIFSPGKRLLVAYSVNIADTAIHPTIVTLKGYRTIQFDTIKALLPSQIEKLPKPHVDIISSWQTGDFINFQFGVGYDGQRRDCSIVADVTTLHDDKVKCTFVSKFIVNADSSINRHDFGSYYTGTLGLRKGQILIIGP